MQAGGFNLGGTSTTSLVARRSQADDAEFDITAMIDLVFMMNIYFLVTFLTAALGEINLPAAAHVTGLDVDTAITLTVISSLDGDSVTIYLGDGEKGEAIANVEEQEERVREAVQQAADGGKTAVLIKAEKNVRLRELFRVSTAAAVEGIKLHVAVMAMDDSE